MTERRNDIIDSFRAYSIVCVMVCHYIGRPDKYGYHVGHDYLWQLPRHAVDVFFVISGFVISMTVLRASTATQFLYKRFARLFPSLLVCSLITFCFTRIVGPSGRVVSPVDFGFSLLLISRKVGFQFTDAVYWTLALEAEFYLLVAASFWLFRDRFWIGVLAGTLVGLTGRYMGFFLIGMSAYYIYNNHLREGALLGAVGLVKFSMYAMHLQIAESLYITLSIGALIVAVFLLDRPTGPVAWLGRISYPLYLLHANIGLGIIDLCTRNDIPLYEGLALAASFSITLAALIHYAVEMPANAALRRVLPRFSPSPAQVPALSQNG